MTMRGDGHRAVTRRSHDEPHDLVELSVFGPVAASRRSGPLELTRAKERAALAALALFHGRAVSTDRLVDALWGDRPPARAEKALQTHIQRLRATFGPGVVETRPDGYALADAVVVDAELFEIEARQCESASRLRAALARWNGEPYVDLGEWPFAEMERARLAELRDRALETCLGLEIDAGPAGGYIAELESMVAEKPLRERRWVLLMTALQRDGRVAEALGTYQSACTVFADELGIDPGPELRALDELILLQGVQSGPVDNGLDRIEQLRRAASALVEAGDPAGAVEVLDTTLALADANQVDSRVRIDLLLANGRARRLSGDQYGAVDSYSEATWIARLHRDPVRVALAALGATGEAWMAGLDPHAPVLALLDEALELLPDAPSPLRARVLARLAVAESMSRPFADADKHAAEALSVAQVIGHPETLAIALHARAVTLDLPRLVQRQALVDELLDLARFHGRRDWEAWALFVQARTDCLYGAVDDSLARGSRSVVIGAELSDPVLVIATQRLRTLEATLHGGYEAAAEAIGETRKALSRVIPDAGILYAGEMAILRLLYGRDNEFESTTQDAEVTFAQPIVHAVAHAMRAVSAARTGNVAEAQRALSALDSRTVQALPYDEFWLPFAWAYTLACWLTRDAARAADFASILQPFADLFLVDRSFVFLGAVRHHLGLLYATAGAHEDAEQHLRTALAEHQRLQTRAWIHSTQGALHSINRPQRN
jgi:DNA-binding SARP family transcriptional activator